MSSCFPVRLAPRESAVPLLLAKIFRAIPPASAAAIPVPVSSARSAVAAADVIVAAVAAQTAVAAVPIAVQTVAQTADARAARDSNAAPVVLAVRVMIAVKDIPAPRAVRSSSAKC